MPLLNLLSLLSLFCASLGGALYLYARAGRRARLLERMRCEVQRKSQQPPRLAASHWQRHLLAQRLLAVLRGIGQRVPLLSMAQRMEVAEKLLRAGFRGPQAIMVVTALALLCMCLCVALVLLFVWPLLGDNRLYAALLCLLAIYLGLLLPRLLLDRLVVRRQRAIERSLPDALDLLVICSNAGLGLNSAIARVAEEMTSVCPALGEELGLTSSELQLSSDTERVLQNLARRTGLESMNSLVNTLLQSRQYGTAITQALRILAASERTARMMRLEEAAAKLAVKITLPMMLFILPTVLIVAAGPAVLGLAAFFGSQG
ncbi:type II secretion system F family protein [Stutzerimonas kirkiae]|uniref:Fimbrial protein n=1 Tax=Stutzerimonas kirkiae TaxID=2211392 RepID=A0A4Q9R406_9GAMM|nr:type II secretion system F family protein [Stutzerimonas kirkiae]TBU93527.1 fimbrial protein [Stutzerimonas kirkiae]TBV01733.1 fimbrial protein [Stutzerimonas kirkiae]TBV07431.1 fimbrial protein [Stutzerimonas kirkiae]TBV11064.1 fimbrial protein [Stutzerimonas kirkiae]